MTPPLDSISTLIRAVRETKGPLGRIALHAVHWPAGSPNARGIIPAGTLDKPPAELEKCDGALRIGEQVEFGGTSPRSGHLHVFNLGTTGTGRKLTPLREHPDNAIDAGEAFNIPLRRLPAADRAEGLTFTVAGPASASAGRPDRLLAIVTDADIDLELADLHPKIEDRDTPDASARSGFAAPPRVDIAKLFRLPPDSWDYGLLEMEIVD